MYKKNKLGKNVLFISIFLISLIIFISIASATLGDILINYPMQNRVINGINTFNASVIGAENVTFYYWNASGSIWIEICNTTDSNNNFFTCEGDTNEIDDGVYDINATARNGTDVTSINITNVTIDNTPPTVEIIYPVPTVYEEYLNKLNYTVDDANPDMCWYSIDGGTTNSTPVEAGINFTNIYPNPGENNWTIYCNDSAGNIGFANTTFNLNVDLPEEVWVNASFSNNGTHFDNVREAVNWVNDSGIITVYTGLYTEEILITKPITLNSTGNVEETIFGNSAIIISSNNITINGFNFIESFIFVGNITDLDGDPFENAINNNGYDGINITNNNICDVDGPPAIFFANSNISEVSGNNITNNQIGIGFFETIIENDLFEDNHFEDNAIHHMNFTEDRLRVKFGNSGPEIIHNVFLELEGTNIFENNWNATSILVLENWNIETSEFNTTFFKDTNITELDGGNFSIFEMVANTICFRNVYFNDSYGVMGVLELGIQEFNLSFSKPVEIDIQVGTDFENMTVDIFKSHLLKEDSWEQNETVFNKNCTIDSDGICTFNTSQASYFVLASEDVFNLDISSEIGGIIGLPGDGVYYYKNGTNATIEADEDSGYEFKEWVGDIENIDDVNTSETFVEMLGNYEITATFKEKDDTNGNDNGETGAVPTPETQKIEWEDDEETLNARVKLGDKIIFNVFDVEHTITVRAIYSNKVDIRVTSPTIDLSIPLKSLRNVDVNNNGQNDIYLFLDRISGGYAYLELGRYEYELVIEILQRITDKHELELKEGESIKFVVEDKEHEFCVDEIGKDYAIISVHSNPIQFLMHVGENRNLDISGDGINEINIYFNRIEDGVAYFILEKLEHEESEDEFTEILEISEEPKETFDMSQFYWFAIILSIAGITGLLVHFKILKAN